MEKLALALYFCELLESVVPESSDTRDILRLFLNCLHILCKTDKEIDLIKSVFELRLMCLIGYMPNLSECENCGCREAENFNIDVQYATIYCGDCKGICSNRTIPLSPSSLSVLRHIVYSEFSKVFNFTASKDTLRKVSDITELYAEMRSERRFKTLSYYKSVRID